MNPYTYIAIIFIRGEASPEHARITEAIRKLSSGQMAPPYGDPEKLTYLFNSAEPSTKIHSQLNAACLAGDKFLLIQVAIENSSAASDNGLSAVSSWVNKNGIRPRTA
jgi:hypothetical protein